MRYSQERKQAVLAKLAPPHKWTVREVADEEGISEPTLYNWRKQARLNGGLFPDAGADLPAAGKSRGLDGTRQVHCGD